MKYKTEKQRKYKLNKAIYYICYNIKEELDKALLDLNYNPNSFTIKVEIKPKKKEDK